MQRILIFLAIACIIVEVISGTYLIFEGENWFGCLMGALILFCSGCTIAVLYIHRRKTFRIKKPVKPGIHVLPITLIISLLFTSCVNTGELPRVKIGEGIDQCKEGDTVIFRQFWYEGRMLYQTNVYHGQAVGRDEVLCLYTKKY